MDNDKNNKNLEEEFRQIIKDFGLEIEEDEVFQFFREEKRDLELIVHHAFEEFMRDYPQKRLLILLIEVLSFWAARNFAGFLPKFKIPYDSSFDLKIILSSKNPIVWCLELTKEQIRALLQEISLYEEWYILDPSYPTSNIKRTTKRIFLYLWSRFLFPKTFNNNPLKALFLALYHELRRYPVISIALWDISNTQKPFLARYSISNLKEMLIWFQNFRDFSTDYNPRFSLLKYLPVCDYYLSILPKSSGKIRVDYDIGKLNQLIELLGKYIQDPKKSQEAVFSIIHNLDILDYFQVQPVSEFLHSYANECRYIIDEIAKLVLVNYKKDRKLFYEFAEKTFHSGAIIKFAYTKKKLEIGRKNVQKGSLK